MNTTSPLPYTLLRRSPLMPGESLGSLLARLVKCNGYDAPYTLQLLVSPELSGRRSYKQENWDNMARPFRARTYERLAALTKIKPIDLYKATEHSLGTTVTPPGQELESIYIGDESNLQALPIVSNRLVHLHFYTAAAAQYCPLCLREDEVRYHRLIWSARAIAACTRHEVLLVNQCVQCQGSTRIRDVAAGYCPTCKADLAHVTPHSVAGDQLGLLTQSILRTWLLGGPMPAVEEAQSLPQASTRALFRVVYGLANSAAHAATDWSFQHCMPTGNTKILFKGQRTLAATPEHMYRIFVTATKALLDWPANFYSFLSSYRDQRRDNKASRQCESGFITDLGALGGKWLLRDWQGVEFHFVQEAFTAYLVENQTKYPRLDIAARYRYNPEHANRFEFVSRKDAMRTLDLQPNPILKLLDAGYLRGTTNIQKGKLSYQLIDRADVQSLAKQWQDAGLMPNAGAANLLGIDWRQIDTLRRAGLLTPVRGPEIDGFPFWVYSYDTVNECKRWLSANATRLHMNANITTMLDVTAARASMGFKGDGVRALLQAVGSGHIRAYLYSKRLSSPPALYFDEADFRAHFGITNKPPRKPNP